VLGVMIACMDFDAAIQLVQRIGNALALLEKTTTAGTSAADEFRMCRNYLSEALVQVALQATSVPRFRWSRQLLTLFRSISAEVGKSNAVPTTMHQARRLSATLFLADWG